MNALYIIVALAISQSCPNPTQMNSIPASGLVTETKAVNTTMNLNWGQTSSCSCNGEMAVSFTLNRENAESRLASGARVWKVGTMPLRVVEMKRNEVKTYNITEEPQGVTK